MIEKPKKTIKKEFVKADCPSPTVSDLARGLKKKLDEGEGGPAVSDSSAQAFLYFAAEVPARQVASRRRGGEKSSFKEGIWLAVLHILETFPDIECVDAWSYFEGEIEVHPWRIYLDRASGALPRDGQLCQVDDRHDDNLAKRYKPIQFKAFQKNYFNKAKKELSDTGI